MESTSINGGSLPNPPVCGRCGAPLTPGGGAYLCPACLLKDGLDVFAATERVPSANPETPGTRIGPYKLLQQIGEGGMGTVWMAEQFQPVRRRVALKVVKLGMDTRQVIARFEAERQALALMDHPNIARVLDAGASEYGRPYFVMELVRGIRITNYCDQNHLSARERLDLFVKVCHAIQHAHQKGIIHRDIKPSNILVTLHDGMPVPKVIDFGIAKATTDQPLTDKTLFTAMDQFIGTPAYMSPEQAAMSGLDIDTRSDIYALGVLLYELLTGKTPFDTKRLLGAGLDEIRRIIREEEPPRPSTRLTSLSNEELNTVAAHRKAEAPRLVHLVRGDLDWIVMKALEKDRTRRYETASGLALDLQRHLNSEPIAARPPNTLYRVQKLVRRHRVAVSAATAVLSALLVALAVSTRLWLQEGQARRRADSAEHAQRQLRQFAEQREAVTRQNLYAADIFLAQQALASDNLGLARHVLEAHRPQPGLVDLRGFEWRYLWHLCQGDQVHTWRTQGGSVSAVAFSPDGRVLASGGEDRTVRLWDVESKELRLALTNQLDEVVALAFSKDGRQLVVGTLNSLATVWDLRAQSQFRAGQRIAGTLSLSGDANWAAVSRVGFPTNNTGRVTRTEGVKIFDTRTGEEWGIVTPASGRAGLSHDGESLATSGGAGVQIWSRRALRAVKSFSSTEPHSAFMFSSDDQLLAAIRTDGSAVRVWEVSSGTRIGDFTGHTARILNATFSPDGRWLATCSADQWLRLWDVRTQRPLARFRGHISAIQDVVFSPDGRRLATAGKDGTVRLWEAAVPRTFRLPTEAFPPCAVSADSRLFCAYGAYRRLTQVLPRVWNLASWEPVALPGIEVGGQPVSLGGHPQVLLTMARPDEGKELLLGFYDVTRQQASRARLPLPMSDRARTATAVSARNDRFALAGYDGAILVWEIANGRLAATLQEHTNEVQALAFSPDGNTLASWSRGFGVKLWDTARWRLRSTLSPQSARVYDLVFSPDSRMLAAALINDSIEVWDLSRSDQLFTFTGHRQPVRRLAFAPDGKTLASTSEDGTLKLWSVAARRELATFWHGEQPGWLGFTPDGQTLLVTGTNGHVHSWLAPFPPPASEPGLP